MREAAGPPKLSTLLFIHATFFDPGSANNTNPCLLNMLFILTSDTLKPSSILHLYPSYGAQLYLRACECPCGLYDSLCTLKLFCSIYPNWLFGNVRESSNTRYWWGANPLPDKDFHLASNAKISWRTNVLIYQ